MKDGRNESERKDDTRKIHSLKKGKLKKEEEENGKKRNEEKGRKENTGGRAKKKRARTKTQVRKSKKRRTNVLGEKNGMENEKIVVSKEGENGEFFEGGESNVTHER